MHVVLIGDLLWGQIHSLHAWPLGFFCIVLDVTLPFLLVQRCKGMPGMWLVRRTSPGGCRSSCSALGAEGRRDDDVSAGSEVGPERSYPGPELCGALKPFGGQSTEFESI